MARGPPAAGGRVRHWCRVVRDRAPSHHRHRARAGSRRAAADGLLSTAPVTPTPGGRERGLLRQHDFSSLWWGQLTSIIGERLSYVALLGLVAEHTHQLRDRNAPVLLAMLANVTAAPALIFSPFTGAWVDRWNLRRVLIISDTLRAVLIVLVPVVYSYAHSLTSVYGVVFALFVCNVFFLPAKSAIVPEVVPGGQLLAANALLALSGVLGTMVAMPIGGWLVDHIGWSPVLLVNAVTYLVSVVSLWRIAYRPHHHDATPHPAITPATYVREVGEGWRLVRSSAPVGLALTVIGAVWLAGGFLNAAGNTHVFRSAGHPGTMLVGVLILILGAGSALGTVWVNSHGRHYPRPWLLGAGLLIVAVGMSVFALSTHFWIFAVAGFLVGVAAAPAYVLSETLMQEGVPLRQRGRVFSVRDFAQRLAFVISGTVAGFLTRSSGTRAAMLACAALVAVAGLVSLAWERRMPREGSAGGAERPA